MHGGSQITANVSRMNPSTKSSAFMTLDGILDFAIQETVKHSHENTLKVFSCTVKAECNLTGGYQILVTDTGGGVGLYSSCRYTSRGYKRTG